MLVTRRDLVLASKSMLLASKVLLGAEVDVKGSDLVGLARSPYRARGRHHGKDDKPPVLVTLTRSPSTILVSAPSLSHRNRGSGPADCL
jgi:hypothetical protein